VKPSFRAGCHGAYRDHGDSRAIWGFGACLDDAYPNRALSWHALVLYVGFCDVGGLDLVHGMRGRNEGGESFGEVLRALVPIVRPLAVLVCTSSVACVLRYHALSNQIASDLQQALTTCVGC